MGKYNGAVITTAGQNLIAQAIAESKTVTFTTAQASSYAYPSSTNFEALTALTGVEKTVDINYAGVYSDTTIQISARFDNDGVDTAFLINTLGFFAQLGTDTPILFAVSTAVTPDQMPVFDADNPSAFIYNMQITVQNADSVTVTVNPAGTVTIGQLNIITNDIYGKIGDLSDLTTDDKASLVNAINEVDGHADTAQASANSAQQMIAPILTSLVAPSGGLESGDQFIYQGLLYKVTAAIAQGGTITINGNCELADSVTEQLKDISDRVSANNFGIEVNITSYNSSTNMYTFPSDGYLELRASTQNNTYIRGILNSADGNRICYISASYILGNSGTPLFVRKGMKYHTLVNDNGGFALFCSLNS